MTEARRRFSALLGEIEKDHDVGYGIKVRDPVVAELRSPCGQSGRMSSGEALLKLAREMERLHPRKSGEPLVNISGHYKEELYGRTRRTNRRKSS